MKQDIKLFISDNLVDFSDEISIPFTYQLEDTSSPAAVKNSFTKNITIPSTPNNNKIFGEIYNLDKNLLYDENYILGAYFDPSKRTPFQLFNNSELVETGYMQLNSISIKNKVINYEITLYGGLGDFFYNLAYDDDGNEKFLKDLTYGIVDESGNTLPSESEMDFTLDKDFVNNCWQHINDGTNTIYNTITFVPSYNGIYEDFDNNKVLINTNSSLLFPTTSITENGTTYTTVNGYALGELNKEYDEWQIRDLRSYKQRPALKLDKFISAICNPENNGGYDIELDSDFFNTNNPYFSKSYILLPTFSTNYIENENQTSETQLIKVPPFDYSVGYPDVSETFYLGVNNNDIFNYNSATYEVDLATLSINQYSMSLSFNFSVKFVPETNLEIANNADILYNGYYVKNAPYPIWGNNAVAISINILDENSNIIANNYATLNSLVNIIYTPANNVFKGYFKKIENGDFYYFSENGNNTFNISLEDIKVSNKLYIQIIAHFNDVARGLNVSQNITYNEYINNSVLGNAIIELDTSNITLKYNDNLGSGSLITKDKLLKNENTPLDYLLSFTKMFNLNYEYDSQNPKKIKILSKNNYFNNNVIDINNLIDYSQEMKIQPLLFSSKFLRLKYDEDEENYLIKKYNNDYGVSYGQKRLKTGYNFNNETNDILSDNIYENVIQLTDNSVYYRNFFNSNYYNCPPFLVDNLKYELFNGDNSTSIDISGANIIDLTKTTEYTRNGYDLFDKPAFFTIENNIKNLSDISNSLILFDGNVHLLDSDGRQIPYQLSDDVNEMYKLNGGPCFLFCENSKNAAGSTIAIKLNYLPHFSRYISENNVIKYSYDFEQPLELYVQDLNYDNTSTIYHKFWESYLTDQFNVNNKKITCYVNLSNFKVNSDLLKNFYYFNNCIWILNKINNYDINSNKTVQCEFIKVIDMNSYLQSQTI